MRRIFETVVAVTVWLAVLAVGAVLASGALAATSPAVVTKSASQITQNSAVLNGTVNPNGSGTTYFFQWGLDKNYGVNSQSVSAGAGTKPVPVHATAGGLIPGTVYHYRLVAANRFGTTLGADRTFKTNGHPPPAVGTGPATGISKFGATLTGVVNPNGQDTTWNFQFGSTTAYGAATNPQTVAATSPAVIVASALPPLKSGTVYHYRLVASHGTSDTIVVGSDATFMTYPRVRPVPQVRATTRPLRLSHRPFAVSTHGFITHPSWIPPQFACTGNVEVRFLRGRHLVALSFVPLSSTCTFASRTVFAHRHQPLSVRVRYLGNHYLRPNHARFAQVRFT